MGNCYIARFKDQSLAALFENETGVMAKFYKNNRWEAEHLLLSGSNLSFTADFDSGGNLCVFAQNTKGDIVLLAYNGSKFKSRKLLNGQTVEKYPMRVHSMKNASLIYNIPNGDNKYKLIQQNAGEKGWEKAAEIAQFISLPGIAGSLFELQTLSPDHGLVFYNSENNLIGYKEVSTSKICEFHPLQRPGELILDYNFLTLKSGIHLTYVTANMFSRRLLYRQKTTAKLSEPIVLWEGPRIENCLLSEIDGEIWAFWSGGENLYTAKAKGTSFEKAKIYTQKFCKKPLRASYITAMDYDDYFTRYVYVDSQKPWDVQILPDMFPDFYPQPKPPEVPPPPPPPKPPSNSEYEERLLFTLKHAEKLKEENRKLKEEISQLKKPSR